MRLLLVEDNDADADLVAEALASTLDTSVELDRVDRLSSALKEIEQKRFDVVLLDLSLPDASGMDGLQRLLVEAPSLPVVVLTGLSDVAAGTRAIQLGAQDYLQKGQGGNTELLRACRYATERAQIAWRNRVLAEVSAAVGGVFTPAQIIDSLVVTLEDHFADFSLVEGIDRAEPLSPDLFLSTLGGSESRQPHRAGRSGPGRLVDARSLGAIGIRETNEDPEDAATVELLRSRQMTSAMIIPLHPSGRSPGRLIFGRDADSLAYQPADLVLAEEIARRMVAAIDYAVILQIAQEERERAEVAGRARDEFLATLSHELRTPLNAILGWTMMLRTGRVGGEQTEKALATIERNARSQVTLIEDVLEVSRSITGKTRLTIGPVDVTKVLTIAVDTMRPAAEAKGLKIELRAEGELATGYADPDRVQQILWNLLSNAVKFTPAGGEILVRTRNVGALVEVSVVDNGQGIEGDLLPHVFDRFRQGDSSSTRAHGGLGLGLSIARHLAELQGATLQADSEGIGRGATFTLRLATAGSPPSTAIFGTRDGQTSKKPPAKALSQSLAGLAILVVEDDLDTSLLLTTLLESAGAKVRSAASAAEALFLLDRALPDLIVSDIGMPGTNGYDFIREVRERPRTSGGRIPAVALTAYARSEDRKKALSVGFDEHVTKPVLPDELLAVLAGLHSRQVAPV